MERPGQASDCGLRVLGPGRRLSVLDSASRPPRNSTRRWSRRGRAVFTRRPSYVEHCWKAYCRATALHGVRYFVGDRSLAEIAFWAVCVASCLALSAVRIADVYGRWASSPPLLSVSHATPSAEAPFPAVSICPRNKSTRFGFGVCDGVDGMASPGCVGRLLAATPALGGVVADARWNGAPLAVDARTFPAVLSDEGVCYTFNGLSATAILSADAAVRLPGGGGEPSGWGLEEGYAGPAADSAWRPTAFPRRAIGNARRSGLLLTMRSEGVFKIVLHSPLDLPIVALTDNYVFKRKEVDAKIQSVRHFAFYPTPHEEAVLSVSPAMTVLSDASRRVDPHHRRCYFPSERRLSFFKVYTQRNCELECVANHVFEVCGCAPIYMPRREGQPVCRVSDCYARTTKDSIDADCDCLPGCTTLGYDAHLVLYGWRREQARDRGRDRGLRRWTNLSRVSIRVKDSTFAAVRRTMSYSRPEFLADCGGLLVLFNGFSIVALVEAVFHLVIRWACRLYQYRVATTAAR